MPNYCPRGRGLFNWSLQQGSAGCKIRVHRIFRVGPHGDDRSGVPLHERCDESDVYKGEVAQVDVVPELVGWFDGVIDGLCSLVDVARGSVGGVAGDVFEEVEERFAHPSVCVHHERDEFLVQQCQRIQ